MLYNMDFTQDHTPKLQAKHRNIKAPCAGRLYVIRNQRLMRGYNQKAIS